MTNADNLNSTTTLQCLMLLLGLSWRFRSQRTDGHNETREGKGETVAAGTPSGVLAFLGPPFPGVVVTR